MRTKWFSIGCFVSFIILILVVFGMFAGLNKLSKNYSKQKIASVKENSFLHLAITGNIIEYNEFSDDFFINQNIDAHSLVEKIESATKDDKIIGILLEPQMISVGYSNLHEIMESLKNFRSNGKRIVTYLERAGNKDYILATVSDVIYMNPSSSAGLFLSGVGSSVMFYKDLFDKLGIDIKVITAGNYKGAGETYSRNSFSSYVKENLQILYSDIYDQLISEIATNREITKEDVKFIYEERDNALIKGDDAKAMQLVDKLAYRDNMLREIGLSKNRLVEYKKYQVKNQVSLAKNSVAVVYLQGEITEIDAGYNNLVINIEKVDEIFDNIEKDSSIKSVVLRINSPGGSALESEIIHNRIIELSQSKTVIISMSDVAASGGYYISTPGSTTFADPFTVTGSIGVVAMLPNFNRVSENLGITTDNIGIGKYNDFLNPFVKPKPEVYESIKSSIDDTYNEFKQRVAEGRDMDLGEVEKHAQGQVWSAKEAIKRNLIDKIGGIDDAVAYAAEKSGLLVYKIEYFPKKKDFMTELLKKRFNLDAEIESKILDKANYPEVKKIYKDVQYIINDPVQARLPFISAEIEQVK